MTEEFKDSANNDARPIDPLDAAIDVAMEEKNELSEKEEVKKDEPQELEDEGDNDDVENHREEDASEEEKLETKEETKAAPEHWPAEDKALLENIKDEEARKLVMQIDKRLQAAHTRRSQEVAEEVKTAHSVRDIFKPYQEDLKQAGLNEITAIPALIKEYTATKEFIGKLQQSPKEVIAGLAKQYGVSLDGLDDGDDYKDPYVAQLEQKVAQLEGKVGQVANSFQQNESQAITQKIDQFAKETNGDGSLKHPHFERLRTTMGNFMAQNPGETLGTAYDKAMRTDPELYQEMVAREVQAKLKAEEKERIRKADIEKAKKAKRNLNVNGSSSRVNTKNNSLDDALNAALEKYGNM